VQRWNGQGWRLSGSTSLHGQRAPAGQGQAPARQAARGARLPDATGATTINKVCGSGMKATMLAHDIINAGSAEIVLSGGMESMSNAPYLLAKARSGYRAGHDRIIDHMMMDGLEDAYETGRRWAISARPPRKPISSPAGPGRLRHGTLTRARKAVEGGAFKAEIAPITLTEKTGPRVIANDEHPIKSIPRKIPGLKPAFRANGTIAGRLLGHADGAAALILAKRSLANRDGLPVLAEIKGHATHSQEPQWFTTAPIPRSGNCSTRLAGAWATSICSRSTRRSRWSQWRRSAISVSPGRSSTSNGGACALGHPIGANRRAPDRHAAACAGGAELKRGIAALCIGGGEAPPSRWSGSRTRSLF